LIQLCIGIKLQSSASFRAIHQIILVLNLYLNLSMKAPSHSTVLLWIKKYGYYELTKEKLRAEDWVILLDESVQFGQNKLLVIYGIRESDIDFTRPLQYQDLTPLVLKSKSSWKAEDIKEQIQTIQQQNGTIRYAVADQGSSIRKALDLMDIPHVYDLTHFISLTIEHLYKNDSEFKEYTQKLAHLRGAQALSKMAHVLPPAQRAKARFMNLRPISDWGMAVLRLLDKPIDQYKAEIENLTWVNQYRSLIVELALLNKMVNGIQVVLKTQGLSNKNIILCKPILAQANTKRLMDFSKNMLEYLLSAINTVPKAEKIICSSDILESSFGKYKNYLQANPMIGITNLCLSLSAFTGAINNNEVKCAFENTTITDIKNWTNMNVGKTTMMKRKEIFKKTG